MAEPIVPRIGPEDVTFTFSAINAGLAQTQTATLKGARTTMQCLVNLKALLDAGLVVQQYWVSADDTISLTLFNPTAGNITPSPLGKTAIVSCI